MPRNGNMKPDSSRLGRKKKNVICIACSWLRAIDEKVMPRVRLAAMKISMTDMPTASCQAESLSSQVMGKCMTALPAAPATQNASAEAKEFAAFGVAVRQGAVDSLLAPLAARNHNVVEIEFPDGEEGDAARSVLERSVHQSHDRLCSVSQTVERGTPLVFEQA